MKSKYAAVYALIVLSLIVTGIFLSFMPDKVPMHYNAAGEINRFGSKYENLIFPLATGIMGGFFLLMARYCRKKNEAGNEKVIIWSAIAVLILFNVMFAYFLWKATAYNPGDTQTESVHGIWQISLIGLGAVFMITGNILPKARMNALVGLRTTWSMKNERVWQKSQRFAGIAFAVCGLCMIVAGFFLRGIACAIAMITLLLAVTVLCVIASYRIYRKDSTQSSEI